MRKLLEKTILVRVILTGVALLVLIVGIYVFLQYQRDQQLLKNPNLAAQVEAQTLVAKVGRLMDLPEGEQPTIATVSDVTKLQDQSFFRKAKNGDKVLIYTKAQKAILYDPKEDKIVEVTVLALEPTVEAPQPVTVALYNGTLTTGLATSVEKQLTEQKDYVTVVAKANAARADYKETIVVDLSADKAGLSGKNAAAANDIAKTLGGKVDSLPQGETKPSGADILVILGQ